MSPEELEKEVKEEEVKKTPEAKKEAKEEEVKKTPKAKKEDKEKEVKKTPETKKEAKGLTQEEIITAIKNMTVLDLAALVKTLENEFGISAAPMAVAASAAAPGQPTEAPPTEEKTEFTVTLKSFGEKKIEVIKAVSSPGVCPLGRVPALGRTAAVRS